jgi:2-octaprenyl-6-methoxyphenol hydroxylase
VTHQQQNHYDIVIVGGGPVGTSLAISLASLPIKIALVEAVVPAVQSESDYDGRSIALSYSSQRILESIGVWSFVESKVNTVTDRRAPKEISTSNTNTTATVTTDTVMRATTELGWQAPAAIKTVHVSHKGRFGVTRIHADEEGVPALGYVLPMPYLLSSLNRRLESIKTIHTIRPAKVIGLTREAEQWQVAFDNQPSITSKLVVAADGTHSSIRSLCGIEVQQEPIEHNALVANIEIATDLPHRLQTVAYERFIPGGALALLPVAKGRSTLIWVGEVKEAEELVTLSDEAFISVMQTLFGYRVGRFLKCGKRWSYPLQTMLAKEQVQDGLVLVGNAAHTLHPIAAQGFNLGLRDVAYLAETISKAIHDKQSITSLSILQEYEKCRVEDQERVIRFTNRLKQFDRFPFNVVSSASLLAIDLIPPLKHRLARLSMGLVGAVPALARGVELT